LEKKSDSKEGKRAGAAGPVVQQPLLEDEVKK